MGIMFWLMISGLILYGLSMFALIFLVDWDSKKRHLYGYIPKIMFFWVYFVWDYIFVACRRPHVKQNKSSSPQSNTTEVTELNYCPQVIKTLKMLYFVAVFSVLLIFFAVIFHDLG